MHAITEAVTSVIGDYGLYAVFTLMLVDAVLPAASELVMVYGGALAAGAFASSSVTLFGREIESAGWAFVAVAVAGTVGYTLGSIGGWAIGLYGGRPYLERHGRWLHVTPEKLDRAESWFERWGDLAVFVSRMLPVVRSFISIPAGIGEMPLVRYTVLTFAGTIPWCFGLAAVGYALGANWERFHESFRYADYAIVVVLALGAAAWIYRAHRKRSRRLAEAQSAESGGR
ncbi:MAG TPA: DedA family protein [Gaiellaceae bacterium]|nr:DedA family protein [Gaiellaceae bacterium]